MHFPRYGRMCYLLVNNEIGMGMGMRIVHQPSKTPPFSVRNMQCTQKKNHFGVTLRPRWSSATLWGMVAK